MLAWPHRFAPIRIKPTRPSTCGSTVWRGHRLLRLAALSLRIPLRRERLELCDERGTSRAELLPKAPPAQRAPQDTRVFAQVLGTLVPEEGEEPEERQRDGTRRE